MRFVTPSSNHISFTMATATSLDMEIIRNFKTLYHSQMLKRVIHALDNEELNCATDHAKKTTVLDAIYMAD